MNIEQLERDTILTLGVEIKEMQPLSMFLARDDAKLFCDHYPVQRLLATEEKNVFVFFPLTKYITFLLDSRLPHMREIKYIFILIEF